jgi:hypothetical protein
MHRKPLLFLFAFFLGTLNGLAVNEMEPNDSTATANDVVAETQLKIGTQLNGVLDNNPPSDSEDTFKVGDPTSLPLRITASYTSAGSDPSVILAILDDNGILKTTFDPSTPIEVTVPKGSGPVYVALSINAILDLSYTITVDVQSADGRKPSVKFLGRPKLGKSVTRARVLCRDDLEVSRLLFKAPGSGPKQTRIINAARKTETFRFRSRRDRVRLTAIAFDSSGNRGVSKRVYRR